MDQALKTMDDVNDLGDWVSNYSVEGDINISPLTDSKCFGCGANFHCNNSSLPGFVPIEIFDEILLEKNKPLNKQQTNRLCRRCFLYKKYNFLVIKLNKLIKQIFFYFQLNVNVCNVDYQSIVGHLKLTQEALILLVVDMADMKSSIYRQLPEIIGYGKPMIVIGKKKKIEL